MRKSSSSSCQRNRVWKTDRSFQDIKTTIVVKTTVMFRGVPNTTIRLSHEEVGPAESHGRPPWLTTKRIHKVKTKYLEKLKQQARLSCPELCCCRKAAQAIKTSLLLQAQSGKGINEMYILDARRLNRFLDHELITSDHHLTVLPPIAPLNGSVGSHSTVHPTIPQYSLSCVPVC